MGIRKSTFDIPLLDRSGRLLRYVTRDEAERQLARGFWRETWTSSGRYAVEEIQAA